MSAAAKSPGKFTISQAIDSLGVSKFTISIFFLVGIAMMFDGYDYMIISYTNTQIMQEFFGPAGNDALKGALSSWSTIGIVVGSFAAGPLSDKFGRKKILTMGTFMYGLLTIPCIFAPNYEVFAVFRVLAGLFLGVCTPIVTTLFTEFTPTKQRSFFITFGMAWMIVGWVMAALVGTVMVQIATWHMCYAIGALPVLYAFIFGKLRQTCGSSLVGRKEPFEAESFARQPRIDPCGHKSRGTGKCLYFHPRATACTHEHEPRIGYGGCAGVGYKSYGLAAEQTLHNGLYRFVFVELMMRKQGSADVEMAHYHGTCARILGKDQVGPAKSLYCSWRHVGKVAHRCRHHEELSGCFVAVVHIRNIRLLSVAKLATFFNL